MTSIRASLIRSGTSKGLFVDEASLPPPGVERDQLVLAIMGSPDPTGMQLNGIGGGISSTSKVAVISKSKREGIDIDYLFGQVSTNEALIDWSGSCGNLTPAAGLYARENGLAGDTVHIWQANLGYEVRIQFLEAEEPISIPGVPGKSPPIYCEFFPTSGQLLPQNKPIHRLKLPDGRPIEATLIYGANPNLFVRAADLGMSGAELPEEINFAKLEPVLDALFTQAAKIVGVEKTLAVKCAWLAAAPEEEADLYSRITTERRVHHAHTGTGAVNLACAAKIPGTIPNQVVGKQLGEGPLRILHPKGVMPVWATVAQERGEWKALSSGFMRTAKLLFEGRVYV